MSAVYSGSMLRIDVTGRQITRETVDEATLKKYVGGTGIGARILYDEVPPGVEWNDPANRLIMATGPLAGTRMGGSGTFSVVTKGCLTDGATTTQANGYWGAYLRFNRLMGLVFQGASDRWVYLYIHDGVAELKDAEHLRGLDTWETEAKIKQELGNSEREMSVFGIGPAGENLVKFAGIIGDKGHAAAHNGCGAVMGSKKVKAVAIARGKGGVPVNDKEQVSALAKQIHEGVLNDKSGRQRFEWGTGMSFPGALATGTLPIKNLTTSVWSDVQPFLATEYRKTFEISPNPCWACPMHHLHIMKVPSGKYTGYVGEEPEYECWAAWGPLIGQKDVATAFMLSNEVDRLGFDTNEAGWIISFVMDCYERGIINKSDTDGLEMHWGNGEAALALLRKIARREGFGNILAEGVKRAAEKIGGEAVNHAVYIQKGHAPRGHDHRARWAEMLDYATSGAGTIETGSFIEIPSELGLKPLTDPFSPDEIPHILAKFKAKRQFVDCLGICMFTSGSAFTPLIGIVNAATGWNMTLDDAVRVASRSANLLRAFNIRHGIGTDVEAPSVWYGSIPVDGPAKGRNVKPNWEHMLDVYYKDMGWDRKTGKPLPETLRGLGLEKEAADLWK